MTDVAVLGVGMEPVGTHPFGSGAALVRRAGSAALADAGLTYSGIGAVYACSAMPGSPSGVRAVKELGLNGALVQNVANASATSAAGIHEAYVAIRSGVYDTALVVGFDCPEGASALRRVTERARGVEALFVPAAVFAMWAQRRMFEQGTTAADLARVAAKNWNNAALNPNAQRRPERRISIDDVLASRMVADPLTSMMCCPFGFGAAAAVLCRADLAPRWAPGRPVVRLAASAGRSETFLEGLDAGASVVGPAPMTVGTAREAYEAAGIGPEDLDLVQVHDAFAVEEIAYYELLGVCPEGDAEKILAEGATEIGGRIPFSTDGGLLGRGHPIGPTGLAQVWENTLQLRGEAGARQVEGAKVALGHLVGTGPVCFVNILVK